MTVFVDPVMDGWLGQELAEYLFGELRHPDGNDEWVTFFEHLLKAYDATGGVIPEPTHVVDVNGREYDMTVGGCYASTLLATHHKQFITRCVEAEMKSRDIRAELEERFGVTITGSYMSQLRRRLAKGTDNE